MLCKRFVEEYEEKIEQFQRSFILHLINMNEFDLLSRMQVCELIYFVTEIVEKKNLNTKKLLI